MMAGSALRLVLVVRNMLHCDDTEHGCCSPWVFPGHYAPRAVVEAHLLRLRPWMIRLGAGRTAVPYLLRLSLH